MTTIDYIRAASAIVIMLAFPLSTAFVVMILIATRRLRRERLESMAELERIAADHVRQLERRNEQLEKLINDRGIPFMNLTTRN